jgi:hypothetical protein
MFQSRRSFFGAAASLVAASAWGIASLGAQSQDPTAFPNMPRLPIPDDAIGPAPLEPRLSPAERMKRNQAEIKKNMARLKEAVGDLQKDFDANSTTTVLSMSAVRKTEEIEKLARQIRSLMRG